MKEEEQMRTYLDGFGHCHSDQLDKPDQRNIL
jgi:hypothetical protein